MSFPLYYFLFLYGLFLLVWLSFSITAIFHMLSYGFKNALTLFSTLIFILVSLTMLGASFMYISKINWNERVVILAPAENNFTVENIDQ
jgi:hypothetical protein